MRRLVGLLLVLGAAQVLAGVGFEGPLENGLPQGWRHIAFPSVSRTTSYAVVTSGNTLVLEAHADASASFVIRKVDDPAGFLRWSWKVDRTILPGDGSSKATDDFPARVWVGFEGSWDDASWSERREAKKAEELYGFPPPTQWIHYVWAGRGRSRGECFDEPYSPDRFKCIALRNANDALSEWCTEERDPRADFRRLFGREPSRIVAIAVMTDADDTGSEAQASYADIAFVGSR